MEIRPSYGQQAKSEFGDAPLGNNCVRLVCSVVVLLGKPITRNTGHIQGTLPFSGERSGPKCYAREHARTAPCAYDCADAQSEGSIQDGSTVRYVTRPGAMTGHNQTTRRAMHIHATLATTTDRDVAMQP